MPLSECINEPPRFHVLLVLLLAVAGAWVRACVCAFERCTPRLSRAQCQGKQTGTEEGWPILSLRKFTKQRCICKERSKKGLLMDWPVITQPQTTGLPRRGSQERGEDQQGPVGPAHTGQRPQHHRWDYGRGHPPAGQMRAL